MELCIIGLQGGNMGELAGYARCFQCLCCRFMQNDTALMGGAVFAERADSPKAGR
ncbi:hypothetical protein [Intestinimonas massiliensis (ex Afouda et al. 2020)]|uniref:hypothetical protein n=1 Tax=Intestinimonas massiliensis (ex Afouda et al. 2020) TaxID=1673721 RepID=UPI003F68B2BF